MTRCRVLVYDAGDYKPLLRRAARAAVKSERPRHPCLMEVSLISDSEMRGLNRMRRGVNRVTDVLSFPGQNAGEEPAPHPETGRVYIGDVLLSKKRAKMQAKEYGHSLERELAYLTVHGALHLMGHDHGSEWDRAVMRQKEEAVMERLGLPR